ncbi:MAG: hypothetical protein QNI84_12870 [Henriciella sp.]|nr:hypothetical protein [Henriciella sp.]
MRGISFARVLLGGAAAGLIIILGEFVLNGVVLAEQWAALRELHNVQEPSAAQYAGGAILTLLYGIVLIWIYAAIRPRFGPGPKAAIVAGLTFWLIAYVMFLLSVWANGFVSLSVAAISIAWGLVEAPVAALVGAWIYREEGVT